MAKNNNKVEVHGEYLPEQWVCRERLVFDDSPFGLFLGGWSRVEKYWTFNFHTQGGYIPCSVYSPYTNDPEAVNYRQKKLATQRRRKKKKLAKQYKQRMKARA